MIKRVVLTLVILSILPSFGVFIYAQVAAIDPVLMTINGKSITKSEFEAVYNKNRKLKSDSKDETVESYLDLFVNFKLKVADAIDLKLDTSAKFQQELEGYRAQLAKPYLTDNDVVEGVIKETYARLQENICASHILVKCDLAASPADTLKAYNKALKIRERIVKGAPFNQVAAERGVSDDTNAKANGGRLGCFTALQMVKPFEDAAYSTSVGDVSMPVRTRFGYHLIYVSGKSKAKPKLLLSHIMLGKRPGMDEKTVANLMVKSEEIYKKLQAGDDFSKLAKQFSQDIKTAKNGGELPVIGVGATPPSFEEAAYALDKIGDYTRPVHTSMGIHIIKLRDKQYLEEYDKVRKELEAKLAKMGRFASGRLALVEQLKKEYNFKENGDNRSKVFESILKNTSLITEEVPVLFSFDNNVVNASTFIMHTSNQINKRGLPLTAVSVKEIYDQYVVDRIISYENSLLETKYPEFKALMQEYYDGMLLFDLTNKNIWTKAVKDTQGLKAFFEDYKNIYRWGDRIEADIYTFVNKKTAKKAGKLLKKGTSEEKLKSLINIDSQLNMSSEHKLYSKGDNQVFNQFWGLGLSKVIANNDGHKYHIVNGLRLERAKFKTFKEAKSQVIIDYQSILEKKWLDSLKQKYTVTIDRDVLNTIK